MILAGWFCLLPMLMVGEAKGGQIYCAPIANGLAVLAVASPLQGLYSLNQRFGVSYDISSTLKPFDDYNSGQLNYLGWYSDGKSNPSLSSGSMILESGRRIDHPIVVGPNSDLIAPVSINSLYQNQPGWFSEKNAWQIGHQLGIDCYTTTGMASDVQNFQTRAYARDYHLWADEIKALSDDFKLMTGEVTDRQTQAVPFSTTSFLKNAIGDYYQEYSEAMPIDVFNLKISIDPGEDPLTAVRNSVRAFRQWMTSVELAEGVGHDYSDSELWVTLGCVSRTGTLLPSEHEKLARLITWLAGSDESSDIIDETLGMNDDANRLVQRWAWGPMAGGTNTRNFKNVTIFDQADQLTDWGRLYIDLVPTHCPEPASLFLMLASLPILLRLRSR